MGCATQYCVALCCSPPRSVLSRARPAILNPPPPRPYHAGSVLKYALRGLGLAVPGLQPERVHPVFKTGPIAFEGGRFHYVESHPREIVVSGTTRRFTEVS